MKRIDELAAYALFLWEDHASPPDDLLAAASDLRPSSLQVNDFHSRKHDICIPLSVCDHQYHQLHLWLGNLVQDGQAKRR
jgi:hypothetical protein